MSANVVIIDDNKIIRELLTIVAQMADLEVVGEAENGEEGVELVRTALPDAVVLDQEMPVLNGVSALPLIREALPAATIVMFSSTDDPQLAELTRARGADAYFVKGVATAEDVISFIRTHATQALVT